MTEPENEEHSNEREQASAALVAAIVRLVAAIGADHTARVLRSVGTDLPAELKSRADDVVAADIARRAGGLN